MPIVGRRQPSTSTMDLYTPERAYAARVDSSDEANTPEMDVSDDSACSRLRNPVNGELPASARAEIN